MFLLDAQGDGLVVAGIEFGRLFKGDELDGGFLHPMLAVIGGIGLLKVELHRFFSLHAADVHDIDREEEVVVLLLHRESRIIEIGIGETMSEGIGDLRVIIEGSNARRSHHDVSVTGLKITVANIDTFGVDGIGILGVVEAWIIARVAIRKGEGLARVKSPGRRRGRGEVVLEEGVGKLARR